MKAGGIGDHYIFLGLSTRAKSLVRKEDLLGATSIGDRGYWFKRDFHRLILDCIVRWRSFIRTTIRRSALIDSCRDDKEICRLTVRFLFRYPTKSASLEKIARA